MKAHQFKAHSFFYMLFILAFSILLLCTYAVIQELQHRMAAVNWVTHTYEVREKLNEVLLNISQMQLYKKSYIADNNKNDLGLYNTAIQDIQNNIVQLRKMTADNAEQQIRLNQLQQQIIILNKFPLTNLVNHIIENQNILIRIKSTVHEMNEDEFTLLSQRLKILALSRYENFLGIGISAIFSFLFLIISFVAIIRLSKKIQDVENEKLIAQELSNEKIQFSLKTAQIGDWDLNLETNIAKRSLLHDQIFGYKTLLNEWTYDMFLQRILPEDRDVVDKKFKDAIANETTWEFQCRIHGSNDISPRWIWAKGKIFKIGGVRHMLGLVQDITKNKDMEKKLQEMLSYTRGLIEASLDLLVTISHDGKITDVNQATELVTGLTREKLIGTDFTNYFSEPEIARKGYQQVFEQGFVRDYPLTIRNVSGQTLDVMYNATVYKDPTGNITGVFAAARDVTARKRAEEKANQYATKLEESNKALQQFAYIASHDLQEPLRVISSYLQLIALRYKGKLDNDADDFIEFALSGAARLQRMIEDLLAYSRVQTQGKPFETVNCENVLQQTLDNLQIAINESNTTITHDPLPIVTGDEAQLIQVFQNLIKNSIKFHGIDKPKIHISAVHKEKEWLFSVRDNGIGIDPKFKDQMFIMFKRFNTTDYPGSGMGLAVCKRIIERHNGKIWVESELGKGSTFYFTLHE
ncbi:MAG: ATP-binding protein [Gammaproteobacteria bacterium]|nr:ATP-binding protein [Gammaproteobacteria bacterium]